MQWWLINDETIKELRDILEVTIREIDNRCGETGCMCDIGNRCLCSRPARDALHSLDTGLHKTEAIPTDFLPNKALNPTTKDVAG